MEEATHNLKEATPPVQIAGRSSALWTLMLHVQRGGGGAGEMCGTPQMLENSAMPNQQSPTQRSLSKGLARIVQTISWGKCGHRSETPNVPRPKCPPAPGSAETSMRTGTGTQNRAVMGMAGLEAHRHHPHPLTTGGPANVPNGEKRWENGENGRTVRCARAVRKVGCFPSPVATGPRVLNAAPPTRF